MADEVLSLRDLNRATLARQHLLARVDRPAAEEAAHLVGLQAQAPFPPYFGLWSRLEGFTADELVDLLEQRVLVRASLHRGTVHLVTATDARWLAPIVRPLYLRSIGKDPATVGQVDGLEVDAVATAARELLDAEPRTERALDAALASRFAGRAPRALGRVATLVVPTVQVPPRALWGRSGQPVLATLEAWTGAPVEADPSLEDLVRRYLGAFGPASTMDLQRWIGLTRLTATVTAIRDELVTFTDERGRTLFDLPDALRPGGSVAAPVRLVAAFDDLLLGHDDRTRVAATEHRRRLYPVNGVIPATVLVDGFVAGTWRWEVARGTATVTLQPFAPWSPATMEEARAEADRLLALAAPEVDAHQVTVEPP